jgi:Na+/H+ antiporter
MIEFEALLGVLLVAMLLAAVARRVGAPYPTFLALGGAALAFLPGAPTLSIDPEVVLALFVAPVLLDAAYDASPRDLRDNWAPVASLAIVAVALTTAAVAVVARAVVPGMSWAVAVTLGALVAPPDAAAAIAVLRQLRPPHRILTILEGESLLNDATALLIYRLAVGAVAMTAISFRSTAPMLLVVLAGSIVVGMILARLTLWLTDRVSDVPTAIVLQFIIAFGVWILADRLGLSAVLTMVSFAVSVARRAPARTPARIRVPSYAVWESVVFVLNVLAFMFIGLQLRPIVTGLDPGTRIRYFWVSGLIVVTVIVVRIAWVMTHNGLARWQIRRFGFRPRRPLQPPTVGSGVIISWSGMRGIISLAAALALPATFPFRGLIILAAFSVVLGTLVLQGLTLGPLLRALDLKDDDPVAREVEAARVRALEAALSTFDGKAVAFQSVREELMVHLEGRSGATAGPDVSREAVHRRALAAARQVVFDMRANDDIGDHAFHRLEEEFDWLELGTGGRGEA